MPRTISNDVAFLKRVLAHRRYRPYNDVPFLEKWRRIRHTLMPLGRTSTGNVMTTYYDTGDSFTAMWAAVDDAYECVRWQTYICKDDNVGRTTVAKLEQAFDRGANVELLYDCGGNITGRTRLLRGLRRRSEDNVIRYRPFFIAMWHYVKGGMHWKDSPSLRNHRKILVVDNKVAFVGGLNIGDDYCSLQAGGNGKFRDTQCRVTGPAVLDIGAVYEDTKNPQVPLERPWRHMLMIAAQHRFYDLKDSAMAARALGTRAATHLRASSRSLYQHALQSCGQMHIPRLPAHLLVAGHYLRASPEERKTMRKCLGEMIQARAAFSAKERAALVLVLAERASYYRRLLQQSILEAPSRARAAAESECTELHQYGSIASDDAAIPEAAQLKGQESVMQVMACNPLTEDWTIPMAMWFVVKNAHRRVWVTTPYYLPHRRLTAAIISAARRGVDVRILAGSRYTTDPWFMWYASQHITMRFLQAGVRVYEFDGGQVMHAKTVVVDSVWCSVGSYNWDVLSNKLMEVCVTSFGLDEAAVLEDHFRKDVAMSREITIDYFANRSLFLRFKCAFFYYGMRMGEKLGFWNYWDRQLSTQID